MGAINRFRQKAKSEGRKILNGIVLSQEASAVLSEKRKTGESIANIINTAILSEPVDVEPIIRQLRTKGKYPHDICRILNTKGIPCGSPGGSWHAINVFEIIGRLGI